MTTHIHARPSLVQEIHMFLLLPRWSISSKEETYSGYLSQRASGPCFSMQEIEHVCVCIPRDPRFSMQDVILSLNPCCCLRRFWLYSQLHTCTTPYPHPHPATHTVVSVAFFSLFLSCVQVGGGVTQHDLCLLTGLWSIHWSVGQDVRGS